MSAVLPTLERVAGIEPAYSAWKADVLPLNYTRYLNIPYQAGIHPRHDTCSLIQHLDQRHFLQAGGGGWIIRGFAPHPPFHRRSGARSRFTAPSNRVVQIHPRHDTCSLLQLLDKRRFLLAGGGGWIRTTEARASDLQSDPFGHSGTPPKGGILS